MDIREILDKIAQESEAVDLFDLLSHEEKEENRIIAEITSHIIMRRKEHGISQSDPIDRDDLISRRMVMALAKDICVPIEDGIVYKHRCIDPDAVKELPSAQPEIKCIANITLTDEQVKEAFEKARCNILAASPERKKGKWIYRPEIGWGEAWVCSECEEITQSARKGKPRYNFCPNCGADMRGDADE